MRVLVLSGSGFIGSAVAKALEEHELWLFHRGLTGTGLANVRHVLGDRQALDSYRDTLRRVSADVVLDMGVRNGHDAARVVETLEGAANRFVVVSSASVYRTFGVMLGTEPGEPDNRPAPEDAPLRRRLYPYRRAAPRDPTDPKKWLDEYDKIPAEQLFLERPGISASVIRLPMVYGPADPDARLVPYVKRMRDARPGIFLDATSARWRNSRAFVTNAAAAVASVVLGGQPGRIYNYAEPGDHTEQAWIEAIGRAAGWNGTVRTVAHGTAGRWARPALDEFPEETNFAQHLRVDSARIRRELGFHERVTQEEALVRTVGSIARSAMRSSRQ
jgi:nucleoside-diphosphate-sugar epimerase